MNSWANIHSVMDTIESSLLAALAIFTNDAAPIVKNFATFEDNKGIKIALDVFTLLFASASSGVWARGKFQFNL
jgi:hypothetical protein